MSGVSGGKNDAFLYEQVKVNYPESFICAQKIVTYIKSSYAFELSLDEQVYLTIHIQRLDLDPEGIVIPIGKGTGLIQIIDNEHPYQVLPLLCPTYYTKKGIL